MLRSLLTPQGGCGADKANGVFFFALPDSFIVSSDLARQNVITKGSLSYKPGEWLWISLLVQGNKISGAFDGKSVFNTTVSGGSTQGFASLGTDSYGLADFDNLSWCLKGFARFHSGEEIKEMRPLPLL